MNRKILIFALLLGLASLSGLLSSAVYADDATGSDEQDTTNPPDTGDNGEGGTSEGDPDTNPGQSSNNDPVEGFGGNGTTRPTPSATINTVRPVTVLDEANPIINNPIRSRLEPDRVDTDASDDAVEDTKEIDLVESGEDVKEDIASAESNNIIVPQHSTYERRNWVLLVVSMFTSLGVIALAIFASIFMSRINSKSNNQLMIK